ncbi:phage major capsid protein [Mycolicibacterium elephantis]|uniref:Major capsid protein n=1 Tax=Mycolicibacterium elephantis TaxID=81858 RepID=A0A1X0D0T6_9MYCO|nr:phage major capsid protein [Mycolicibacterium elephantis]ORA66031.1 major capsid protein [Mycolicibacterium elephantis]
MTITTTTSAKAWSPDVHSFSPADAVPDALILQCSTVAGQIEGDSPVVRVAFVNDDEASFTAEGAEIDESTPELAEVLVHTAKITQLVRLSNEQFSQDGTDVQLSHSVARAITRRGDLAFVAESAPTPPAVAPVAGIANVSGIVDGGEVDGNLDALVDLLAELQENLANPSHILVGPKAWAALRKLKVGGDGVNQSLLGAGTTDAAPLLLSVPVIVNTAVPANTGLVVDQNAIVSAVGNVKVATSEHEFFSSDSVALRATWRVGHAVVRPDRIGKFTVGEDDES